LFILWGKFLFFKQ
jgi:protein phosphatase 2C family protein 2/3